MPGEATGRCTSQTKEPTDPDHFDVRCKALGLEHRPCPPRHLQTNGIVERLNARIAEVVAQTRFKSAAELETTLRAYVRTNNHRIPGRALGHITPIQTLNNWHARSAELFQKRVHALRAQSSAPAGRARDWASIASVKPKCEPKKSLDIYKLLSASSSK